MKWTSFQNKVVDTETIDHQHLSNAYWYCRVVLNHTSYKSVFSLSELKQIFSERFNGQILPYRPHVDFKWEIEFLKKEGFLKWETKWKGTITFENEVIGEIYLPH